MLARSGTYLAQSRVIDDDGVVWADFECTYLPVFYHEVILDIFKNQFESHFLHKQGRSRLVKNGDQANHKCPVRSLYEYEWSSVSHLSLTQSSMSSDPFVLF